MEKERQGERERETIYRERERMKKRMGSRRANTHAMCFGGCSQWQTQLKRAGSWEFNISNDLSEDGSRSMGPFQSPVSGQTSL